MLLAAAAMLMAGVSLAYSGQPRLDYVGMHDYPKFTRVVFETRGLPPKSFNIRYDELRGRIVVFAPGGIDYSFKPVRDASDLVIDVDYAQLPDSSIGVLMKLTGDALGFRVSYLDRPERLVVDVYRSTDHEPIMPISRRVETVVIDPGHGGGQTGSVAGDGLVEKDMMVDLAKRLASRLERMGYHAVLTRSGDAENDYDTREGIANNAKGDLYVTLHSSAGFGLREAARGVYVMGEGTTAPDGVATPDYGWEAQQAPYLPDSLRLADELSARLKALGGGGVISCDLPLYGFEGLAMPAALVEVGSLRELSDESFRDKGAEAVAQGINAYAAGVVR